MCPPPVTLYQDRNVTSSRSSAQIAAIHSPQRSRSRFTAASLTGVAAEFQIWSAGATHQGQPPAGSASPPPPPLGSFSSSARARASSAARLSVSGERRAGPSSLAPDQAPIAIAVVATNPSQAPYSSETSTGGAGEIKR